MESKFQSQKQIKLVPFSMETNKQINAASTDLEPLAKAAIPAAKVHISGIDLVESKFGHWPV